MTVNSSNVNFFSVDQFSGALIVSGSEIISDIIYGNEYVEDGGVNTAGSIVIGNQPGSAYSDDTQNLYLLLSGTTTAGNLTVGNAGDGQFEQLGGVATVNTSLVIATGTNAGGYSSTYLMGGGTLTLANGAHVVVGESGPGTFNQGDGTVSGTGAELFVGVFGGSSGTYDLDAGTLSMDSEEIGVGNAAGNTAAFVQTGGTNAITAGGELFVGLNPSSTGTYALSGSGASLTVGSGGIAIVGYNGAGLFTQSGGVVAAPNAELAVGDNAGSSGTYDLSGGALTTGTEYIGYDNAAGNTALFAQTGGTNSLTPGGQIYIGELTGATGAYSLGGSGLLSLGSSSQLIVGYQGNGIFTQSGGTVSGSAATLIVGESASASGTYALSGGSLTMRTEKIGTTTEALGVFVQTGGTNTISPSGSLTLQSSNFPTTAYTLGGGSLVLGLGASLVLLPTAFNHPTIFNQTGGAVLASGATLVVGYGLYGDGNEYEDHATYTLSGTGVIAASFEEVGYAGGDGGDVFTQTGGANTILTSGSMIIGVNPNSIGAYALSGSGAVVLDSGATLIVGGSGQGTFTQSGGTVSGPAATLIIGNTSRTGDANPYYGDTTGVVNLSAGYMTVQTEQIGAVSSGSNPASFAQTGGTNEVTTNGVLNIGENAAAAGTYTLSGSGTLLIDYYAAINVGDSGAGTFTQSGGTVSGTGGTLFIGSAIGSSGTYTLGGGTITMDDEYIGYANGPGDTALFVQTGGTNTLLDTSFISLDLGANPGANGAYSLSNGALLLPGAQVAAVGGQGTGTFTQSGGSVSGSSATLSIGGYSGSSGTYNLSGGTLSALFEIIGQGNVAGNTAQFIQTGGVNTINSGGYADLGYGTATTGTYALSGSGSLILNSSAMLYVGGGGGTGLFNQTGGALSGSAGTLIVGESPGAAGTYNLSGGSINLNTEEIGWYNTAGNTALFAQTGGTNTIVTSGSLALGVNPSTSGTYTLSGSGSLILGTDATLTVGDEGAGIFTQTGGALSGSAGTLIVGESPGSAGTYNLSGSGALTFDVESIGDQNATGNTALFAQTGGTNTISTLGFLTIGLNASASGTYTLSGSGSLILGSNATLTIGNRGAGTFTQSGGAVSGSAAVLVVGNSSGSSGAYNLSGGTLSALYEIVGFANVAGNTAQFIQTGGVNTISPGGYADLGYRTATTGTYALSGSGSLILGSGATLTVGNAGTGIFTQTGGAVSGSGATVTVGYAVGSSGVYNLSGGYLTAGTENVGDSNSTGNIALFAQTGGTNEVTGAGNLYIGYNSSSSGTYTLSGTGTLDLDSGATLTVGNNGAGIFTQGGGVVSGSGGTLIVGNTGGSSGTYNLSGGSLTASTEQIGEANTAGNTALFAQTGGTNTVSASGNLAIGEDALSTGTYALSGSGALVLNSGASLIVGWVGTGLFNQSGGAVTGSGATLIVGKNGGSIGTYNLSAGSLAMLTENIGLSGSGVFLQTGGTNIVSGTLAVGGSYTLSHGTLTAGGGSGGLTTRASGTFAMQGDGVENGDFDNYGAFKDSGGHFNGTIENYATAIVIGTQNAETFTSNVTNESGATFTTMNANVTFSGTFTNNGTYISEPSTQSFNTLVIGPSGSLAGGSGDIFDVTGNVVNTSTNKTAFNLSASHLTLQGAGTHNFTWTGTNLGRTVAGYGNNFSIGVFELQSGVSLDILNGNGSGGLGIYVDALDLDGGVDQISSIDSNGFDIFYNSSDPANAYLDGEIYDLPGGGEIEPIAVPEPGATTLLLCAAGLVALRIRRKR
jgi:hypothetical protein